MENRRQVNRIQPNPVRLAMQRRQRQKMHQESRGQIKILIQSQIRVQIRIPIRRQIRHYTEYRREGRSEHKKEYRSESGESESEHAVTADFCSGCAALHCEKGDSLMSISKAIYHDTSMIDKICSMNQIENMDMIYEGQDLILP